MAKQGGKGKRRRRTKSQERQSKAYGVVLIHDKEKQAIGQPAPDEDIGDDAHSLVVGVYGNGTAPIERYKVPGKRAAHGTDVNGAGGSAMAEIGKREVEEVDDEQELCEPVVAADKEVDEAEQQQIVGNEVRANVCRGRHVHGVAHVQGVGVGELHGEEEQPVDRGEETALRKGRRRIVLPEAVGTGATGGVKGVVEGCDDEEEIAQRCGDFVEENGLG